MKGIGTNSRNFRENKEVIEKVVFIEAILHIALVIQEC